MEYKFWHHLELDLCLVERVSDGHFYCTDWLEYYSKDEGKRFLIPFLKDWETDAPDEYDIRDCLYKGSMEIPDTKMTHIDRSILQRCIDKEGLYYAMFYYSDYETVEMNRVQDFEFHTRLTALRDAYSEMKMYLKLNDIEVER